MRLGQFTPQLKLLFHTERVNKWLKDEDIYPILVEFDLSNACNQACDFCTFRYIKDKSILKTDVAERTIIELSQCGVKAINWTGGGEPLIHKDYMYLTGIAHATGLEQGLFTNGVLLDDKLMSHIARTHKWVRFSIDAGTPETYQRIRKRDDFDKVISNVKKMVAIKGRCQVGIGFVITPSNFNEIPAFSRLVKETGVDYGQYKPCLGNYLEPQIEAEWWEQSVKPLLEKEFEWNDKLVINLYKLNDLTSHIDREYKVCYGHSFCPCIGATGDVWLCTHMRDIQGYSLGNLYENSFKEIWASAKRQEVIRTIDFSKCQFGCKNNEINKVLYQLRHPNPEGHYNFL